MRANPFVVVLLGALAAACGVALALVAIGLILAGDDELGVVLTAVVLGAPLLWAAVAIGGSAVAAARCRVSQVDEGTIEAVCVTPSLAQVPRFRTVRIAVQDIVGVEHGEHLVPTPWAPEVRQCAWVVTRDGARHVIASGRGVGGGSLSVTRAAERVAVAAGIAATLRTNAPIQTRGLFGGARLIGP